MLGVTGSKPPRPHGEHLNSLFAVKIVPLKKPCSLYASIEYTEQVGQNLQSLPIIFDNVAL